MSIGKLAATVHTEAYNSLLGNAQQKSIDIAIDDFREYSRRWTEDLIRK